MGRPSTGRSEEVVTERLDAEHDRDVARAAELLRGGAIIAFPTETVYGLGARADDPDAVARLRALKGRPDGKPFSLLIADAPDAARYAVMSPAAVALARAFWPGPLTMVLPAVSGGDVGLRCPDCAVARAILRLADVAAAAPSANESGRPPATSAEQVLDVFEGRIAAVVDGGPVRLGHSSTVIRLTGPRMEILREGGLHEASILEVLRHAGQGG
jgi:L-threonylcarbamoyladenylate synthase